ncbi:flagellar assembly protein FliW [Halobacillus litoralis]|uniref:flagellar assembly protein FliW n=1 Tax=Halobacillus litoralis TaxID=45668 RepID=UPI001CFD6128|nr:flagellar assembly protein FliW [Halobacillus litoralis]
MKIKTKHFGDVEVKEEGCFHFEHGLPGFENYHTFALLPVDEKGVYMALQSIDESGIALIVTNPYLFLTDYEFDLDESTIAETQLEIPEDAAVYNVLTLRESLQQSTINLKAPIVLNARTKKGKQVILNNESYQTKHPLFINQKGGVVHARS